VNVENRLIYSFAVSDGYNSYCDWCPWDNTL